MKLPAGHGEGKGIVKRSNSDFGKEGAVKNVVPENADVKMAKGGSKAKSVPKGHTDK